MGLLDFLDYLLFIIYLQKMQKQISQLCGQSCFEYLKSVLLFIFKKLLSH